MSGTGAGWSRRLDRGRALLPAEYWIAMDRAAVEVDVVEVAAGPDLEVDRAAPAPATNVWIVRRVGSAVAPGTITQMQWRE